MSAWMGESCRVVLYYSTAWQASAIVLHDVRSIGVEICVCPVWGRMCPTRGILGAYAKVRDVRVLCCGCCGKPPAFV
eukprot:2211356-Prymnesium_polylepis.1